MINSKKLTLIIATITIGMGLFAGSQLYIQAGREVAFFTVEGMTCESCERAIQVELTKNRAIKNVTASYETGIVVVTYDKRKLNESDIEPLISSAGYSIEKEQDELRVNNVRMKFLQPK